MNSPRFADWLHTCQQDRAKVADFNLRHGTGLSFVVPKRTLLQRLLNLFSPAPWFKNKPSEEVAFLAHCADLYAREYPGEAANDPLILLRA